MCYETLFSSLKCNADDQLSGTVPPNQSSSLAGTMGLFSLCTHALLGLFLFVFFFFHRRPLSKDTLSTAVPLHVERWRCRVSAPVEQKLFYSPFSHKSTLFQTAVEDSFNIFLLFLARKNNYKYHSEADKNNNVRLKQEPCPSPERVMRCRSTCTSMLEKQSNCLAIKRLQPPLSQCGPRIERLCWVFPSASGSGYAVLIGFYRDRCDSSWPRAAAPVLAVLRRAAQGIELHLWDHPGYMGSALTDHNQTWMWR